MMSALWSYLHEQFHQIHYMSTQQNKRNSLCPVPSSYQWQTHQLKNNPPIISLSNALLNIFMNIYLTGNMVEVILVQTAKQNFIAALLHYSNK